jgi:hypothetical protein
MDGTYEDVSFWSAAAGGEAFLPRRVESGAGTGAAQSRISDHDGLVSFRMAHKSTDLMDFDWL